MDISIKKLEEKSLYEKEKYQCNESYYAFTNTNWQRPIMISEYELIKVISQLFENTSLYNKVMKTINHYTQNITREYLVLKLMLKDFTEEDYFKMVKIAESQKLSIDDFVKKLIKDSIK